MKLKMLIELDYDAEIVHGDDPEAIEWFYETILGDKEGLFLHSNEIGDTVGLVKVLELNEKKTA